MRRYGHPARLPLTALKLVAERQKESGNPQVGQEMADDARGSKGGFSAAHCLIRNELIHQVGIEGRAACKMQAKFLGSLRIDRLGPYSEGTEGGETGPERVR